MVEDKASALRETIINFVPQRLYGGPVLEEDILKIDISRMLKPDEFFCLDSITVGDADHGVTIRYVPWEDYNQFRIAVENILDAVIVNDKQRKSIQKLLNDAFFNSKKFEAAI